MTSSLLVWGLSAPPPWGSRSCSSLTPAHEVLFSPLLRTCFAPRLAFCTVGKLLASLTVGSMSSGLSVEVGLGLLGLYLWWGKLRLVTPQSRPGFVVIPKALAMARLAAAASLLAILPLSSSQFYPLAPYC